LGGHFIEQCVEIISGVGHISCFSIIDNNCMQQPTCPGKFFILNAFFPPCASPNDERASPASVAYTTFTKVKIILKHPILTLERHCAQGANQGRCGQKQANNLLKLSWSDPFFINFLVY
jgi:hypothetical protein